MSLDKLNPRQKQAVKHLDSPLLVLAGAGSGKTRVITQKIAYLIRDCGMRASHIAAVTFTNKAAREMKERVGGIISGKESKGLTVSTFHTLGLNILKREHALAGLRPGFSIYDASDSQSLLRDIVSKELGEGAELADKLQWKISAWKNALTIPSAALAAAEDPQDRAAAEVYGEYVRHLRAFNAVDFDDLIMLPALVFRKDAESLERWQNKMRYLLVDEYQDTNSCQYELIKRLVGARGALTVVGDDDQSIYAWRGAQPENLQLLAKDYPTLSVIKLEQNYRSTGRILKAANQLIANNPHVYEKALWSELGFGDSLRVIECRDELHEAERVVTEIIAHKFKHRTDHRDYAILYRGNHQSRVFEKTLRAQRIPYFITGGSSFFERAEIKDLVSYLRLIANPDDDVAFLRVVNTPRREIGATTLEKLGAYAHERRVSMVAASTELGLESRLGERALEHVRRFTHWLNRFSERSLQGDPPAVVKELIAEINYEDWLKDDCGDIKIAQRRMENVHEFTDWIGRICEKEPDTKSLSDLASHMTLLGILDRQAEENTADAVHLMTLHGAKGLEFPHVFIVGMEEDLLPHRTAIEEGSLEEERRLAYVGITRAQRTLTFTYAARRKRFGELAVGEPSRFLKELPADDLQWEGGTRPVDPVEQKQRGQAHLAGLRGLLGK